MTQVQARRAGASLGRRLLERFSIDEDINIVKVHLQETMEILMQPKAKGHLHTLTYGDVGGYFVERKADGSSASYVQIKLHDPLTQRFNKTEIHQCVTEFAAQEELKVEMHWTPDVPPILTCTFRPKAEPNVC